MSASDRPQGLVALVRRGVAVTPVLGTGIAVTLVLAVVAGAGRIVTPLTVQYVIDHGLTATDGSATRVAAVAVGVGVAATVAAGVASWLLNRRVYARAEQAFSSLRRQVLARLHAVPPHAIDDVPSADRVSRVTSDIDTMTSFLQAGGVLLLTNVSQMVLAAAVMLVYSWPITLVVLAFSLALFALMSRVQRIIARRFVAVRESVSHLQSTVGEVVDGIEVVRTTGTTELAADRLDAAIHGAHQAQRRSLVPLHTNTAFGEIAISVLTVLVVVGGTWWTTERLAWLPHLDLTAGRLVALVFLVTFFVRPLQSLVQMLGEAQNAAAGWRRALSVLDVPSGEVGPDDGHDLAPGPVRVDVTDLSAAYGGGPVVLHGVDVVISPGEHIAVVGRTGSGKSTFAKVLTRQLAPAGGEVRLGGRLLHELTDRSVQRRIAIVPQDPFLFDTTIADNIAAGAPGQDRDAVVRVVELLGIQEWVALLPDGLDTRVGTRGDRLSAGERQLVALARTAFVDPDLLVLDEATSGVDPATDVRVQAALAVLMQGRTTVSIAHRMVTAETADRVLVFDGGRLVQVGPHRELVEAPGPYAGLHRAWTRREEELDLDLDVTFS
ncbi:MAG: ABC transporter ATP-binding protein [Aeromicrobium sp.]